MSTIRSNRKCSKAVGISSDILGNVRKSSENRQKYSEVARTFSEIPVMKRQKSHAFDLEKVGRYTLVSGFDSGYSFTHIVPVFNGKVLKKGVKR